MIRRLRRVLFWAVALSAIALVVFAITPPGRYLVRAAVAEARILWRRRPISEVVADPATDAPTRAKLRAVLAARQFAADSLGLRARESFTTFSQLDRDTLVLVVAAAHRDRLVPHTWWFPIVGRVPYKGFFDFGQALRTAESLRADGLDTYVRSASAFSTLGWFNDPLLSTTLRQDSLDLVNTVIHELTHNTFYEAGEAAFNESFANFVGARGAERFFLARGDSAAAREVAARWSDEKRLGRFWLDLSLSLDSAFAAHPDSRADRLAGRHFVYARARQRLLHDVGPQLRTIGPRSLERTQLDNAALLARRTYLSDLELFDEVYVREGRDLDRAVERIMTIADDEDEPFDAIRRWLASGAAEPPAE